MTFDVAELEWCNQKHLFNTTRETDKTTTQTNQRKHFRSQSNVSISPHANCWFAKLTEPNIAVYQYFEQESDGKVVGRVHHHRNQITGSNTNRKNEKMRRSGNMFEPNTYVIT